MKPFFFCFLLILCISVTRAQISYLADTAETSKLSESIAKKFFKKDFSEGIDELKKYWTADKSELDELKEITTTTMEKALKRYGEFISYSRFKTKTKGDFVREEVYVIRMEYHILRLNFLYYKSNKGWMINNFTWDDKIGELIK
jgi:hypothetical protein